VKLLVALIVLNFAAIAIAILYIAGLEIREAYRCWRHEREVQKSEFIRKLKGVKNYEIVETILNGKMRQVERRIK
jgi:hypothetical protein